MSRPLLFLTACLCALPLSPSASARSAERDDTPARLREAKALRARSRQHLEAAEREYRAVLQREPRNLEAQRGLARVLRDRGAEELAVPYLREAAERSGEGVDHARLGWALFRAGRWAEATDAFAAARERGLEDEETARGEALAAAAARAELPSLDAGATRAAPPATGWGGVWSTLLNGTGIVVNTVQRLMLGLIALLIVGSIVLKGWGTLMGRAAPTEAEGMPLRQWRGLAVRDMASGRRLGRVRRPIYDPKLGRVVGFQTGGRWRWQVLPFSAVRGAGPAGLLVQEPGALVPRDRAGELGTLARTGCLPLGPGRRLKRVVTEEGRLLAFARPHRQWIDGATGQVTFEVSPSRFHDAWRVTLSALQFGPLDWIMGKLLDHGLARLPGRLSVRLRLPASLICSADRDVVIVSGEAEEWIEQHFQRLEVETQVRLARVREGVAKARPVVEAGVARARPVLAKARDSGVALARRSAEAVAAGRKGAAVDSSSDSPAADQEA